MAPTPQQPSHHGGGQGGGYVCGCWVLYRVAVQQLAACRPMLAVQPLYRSDLLAEALATLVLQYAGMLHRSVCALRGQHAAV